ncbi:MAG: D-alanyl-D-alanine carboxypeptidase/D-alanyl-D-alanine-endopeptidase [Bacteroidota bacterium]
MRLFFLFVLPLVFTSCVTEQPLLGQPIPELVRNLANEPELRHAQIGIDVIDLATGQSIASFQAEKSLIPASTQKLITTAAALNILGPDATFQTRLIADGTIENGTLQGHLFLVGGGDPCLGSPNMSEAIDLDAQLQRWVNAVWAAGIRRIEGYVIGDGSYYGSEGHSMSWPWSDIGNYYGVGIYGLNLHENFYYLDFQRQRELEAIPAISGTRPNIPSLVFQNEVRTAGPETGDNAYIFGAPYNYRHFVRGTIPAGSGRFTIKGAVPDPPLFAAQQLQASLETRGITTVRPAASAQWLDLRYTGSGQLLHEQASPDLLAIAGRTNLRSVNLYAEALLRAINKNQDLPPHEMGTTAAITQWLADQGLSTEGVRLNDGSGLSPRNYFPPRLLTGLLQKMDGDENYLATIPLAGRTGSLRNSLKGTAAEGRLYAKSGSVDGVRCYAGYVHRSDGQQLAFAVMVNNYTTSGSAVRRLLQEFMVGLCVAEL